MAGLRRFTRALLCGGPLKHALILAISLALTLSTPPTASAAVYTVPPDIAGDLNGTAGGDTITINNGGTVTGDVNGLGGSNTISNSGTVGQDILGNDTGTGNVTIHNNGTVGSRILGIDGPGTGDVHITNTGTVVQDINGRYSGTGDVYINNSGTVGNALGGSASCTGDVYIINSGTVGYNLGGSEWSTGDVYINNSGRVTERLYGLIDGTGNVVIDNSGTVVIAIIGLYYDGSTTPKGNVTINNSGMTGGLVGNYQGVGNVHIANSGTADQIIGNYQGTGNTTIYNVGTSGQIIGNFDGNGDVVITNSGSVGIGLFGVFFGTGNVIITNSGTLASLVGADTGNGSVTITNTGTVQNALYGNARGIGVVTITNSGHVLNHLYGSFQGTGNVTIINSGSLAADLFGNARGTGNVVITNSGTVQHSIYGTHFAIGNNDVTITNNGSVGTSIFGHFQGSGNAFITNSGSVGGDLVGNSGGIGDSTIHNSGTVGGSIFAGPGNDKVTLAGGSVVGGAVDGQAGTDALFLQGPGVVSVPGGGITGFESATMNGNGYAVYTGAWNFGALNLGVVSGSHSIKGSMTTPLTLITGGGLYVNGNLYSPVTLTGGVLGGSGTVHGNVTNGGTVSPGNSIGTLTINGNYTQNAGSFYLCEMSASGRSDLLRVTGAVDIQGGVLQAVLVRGLFAGNTKWTVLTADGGITGRFSGVKQLTSSLTLSLSMTQSADRVGLVISRRPYAELADTPNQLAVATTLDAILPSALAGNQSWSSFMTMLDFDYDLAQMRAAFRALSPEMYDALSGAAMTSARAFGLLMADRSRSARAAARLGQPDGAKGSGPVQAAAEEVPGASQMAGPAPASGWSLWARTLGGWSYQSRDSEVAGYSLSTGGVAVGADGPVFPWLRLGVAMAAGNTDLSWNGQAHDGDQQSIMAGVYATAGTGGLHIDGSLSYGSYDNSATRVITMDGVDARAKSSFDGTSLSARLGGGYDFKVGGAVFGPTASISYLRLERDGFTEHGADFLSLKVKEQTEDYWASSLGFSAAWLWQRDDFSFMPRLAATWQHNFNVDRREVTASFVGYDSAPFTVHGAAPATDLLTIEAGVTTQFTEAFSAYLEYALAAGQGFHSHGFTAGVSWAF